MCIELFIIPLFIIIPLLSFPDSHGDQEHRLQGLEENLTSWKNWEQAAAACKDRGSEIIGLGKTS